MSFISDELLKLSNPEPILLDPEDDGNEESSALKIYDDYEENDASLNQTEKSSFGSIKKKQIHSLSSYNPRFVELSFLIIEITVSNQQIFRCQSDQK